MTTKYVDYCSLDYDKKAVNYGGESILYRLSDENRVFKRYRSDLGTSILKSKERNLEEMINTKGLEKIAVVPENMVVSFGLKSNKLVGIIMEYIESSKPITLMNFNFQIYVLSKVKEMLFYLEEKGFRHFDLKADNIIFYESEKKVGNLITYEEHIKLIDMDSATKIGVKSDYTFYDRLHDYLGKGGQENFNAEIYLYNLLTYELLLKNSFDKEYSEKDLLLSDGLANPKINSFCKSLIYDEADQIGDHEFLIDYINDIVKCKK